MKPITDQLRALVETGTEEEVRAFIAEHFNEFPERMQRDLSVQLFKEALSEEIQERTAILAIKKQAVEMIAALEAEESTQDGK